MDSSNNEETAENRYHCKSYTEDLQSGSYFNQPESTPTLTEETIRSPKQSDIKFQYPGTATSLWNCGGLEGFDRKYQEIALEPHNDETEKIVWGEDPFSFPWRAQATEGGSFHHIKSSATISGEKYLFAKEDCAESKPTENKTECYPLNPGIENYLADARSNTSETSSNSAHPPCETFRRSHQSVVDEKDFIKSYATGILSITGSCDSQNFSNLKDGGKHALQIKSRHSSFHNNEMFQSRYGKPRYEIPPRFQKKSGNLNAIDRSAKGPIQAPQQSRDLPHVVAFDTHLPTVPTGNNTFEAANSSIVQKDSEESLLPHDMESALEIINGLLDSRSISPLKGYDPSLSPTANVSEATVHLGTYISNDDITDISAASIKTALQTETIVPGKENSNPSISKRYTMGFTRACPFRSNVEDIHSGPETQESHFMSNVSNCLQDNSRLESEQIRKRCCQGHQHSSDIRRPCRAESFQGLWHPLIFNNSCRPVILHHSCQPIIFDGICQPVIMNSSPPVSLNGPLQSVIFNGPCQHRFLTVGSQPVFRGPFQSDSHGMCHYFRQAPHHSSFEDGQCQPDLPDVS